MEFLEKLEKNPYGDLWWNVPEGGARGVIAVIGGNGQSFRAEVKTAELLGRDYPVSEVRVALPDALQGKLPEVPGMVWLPSTESGSFAEAEGIRAAIEAADFTVATGDFSKNKVTMKAVASAVSFSERPLLVTRDAVDLLAETEAEKVLARENLMIFGSVVQLSKLFRAVYYPKMLMASQSLVQVSEALHKFTLSYGVCLITLHNEQVLVAKDGKVVAVPLEKTGYSPFLIWGGELAAKIAVLNLYNPGKFLEATVAALFGEEKSPGARSGDLRGN